VQFLRTHRPAGDNPMSWSASSEISMALEEIRQSQHFSVSVPEATKPAVKDQVHQVIKRLSIEESPEAVIGRIRAKLGSPVIKESPSTASPPTTEEIPQPIKNSWSIQTHIGDLCLVPSSRSASHTLVRTSIVPLVPQRSSPVLTPELTDLVVFDSGGEPLSVPDYPLMANQGGLIEVEIRRIRKEMRASIGIG
jgi:hypothetical protein